MAIQMAWSWETSACAEYESQYMCMYVWLRTFQGEDRFGILHAAKYACISARARVYGVCMDTQGSIGLEMSARAKCALEVQCMWYVYQVCTTHV